ncbi:MAG: TIGR02757 family protein, partial [Bacteroidales bacterium]|nr:TIGR02757 family protein [Bacteroidales bacterium]
PKYFYDNYKQGRSPLQDIEISAILCAHLAWGRREMIVRDCGRLMDEMRWSPFEYVMSGKYRNDNISLHRTIKWSEIAKICTNLRGFYLNNESLEILSPQKIREEIFGRSADPKAANKKIHMFRRWMVRDDSKVDLGVWKRITPAELIIPLDVHVHRNALSLGITSRKSADIVTAQEITDYLKIIFPNDPCRGDFALFAYSASKTKKI